MRGGLLIDTQKHDPRWTVHRSRRCCSHGGRWWLPLPSPTSWHGIRQTTGVRHLQASELRLPLVECRLADPVTTVNQSRPVAQFLLAQDRNHLFFRKSALLSDPSPLFDGLPFQMRDQSGSRSGLGARIVAPQSSFSELTIDTFPAMLASTKRT